MKRKYKETQTSVDDTVVAALQAGESDAEAMQCIQRHLMRLLVVDELLEHFARVEFSASKQRLRAKGILEITKGNVVVLVENMNPDDVEFIASRRASRIAGQLKSLAAFNQAHGRSEAAAEAAAAMSQMSVCDEVDDAQDEMDEAFTEPQTTIT
ncbi:hypothetical protein LCGC14_1289680 [marine sediment metagenome]|uniref:Uncharacterized protein n=1 Tax=marine sediment metagenome TaxID=412755 RepID=A0A0F9N9G3_9ZZZZ